jgi:hypothetical protein
MRTLKVASLWAAFALVAVFTVMLTGTPATALAQHALPFDVTHLLFIGAIGKASDMVIYQAEFQTGLIESLTQFLNAFNEASRGAIRLVPNALKGHYSKNAFFKDISGLITRRDITSVAAVTPLAMTQDEVIGVKINRKVGPVSNTIDSLVKVGMTEEEASRAFGKLAGEHKMRDMLNTAMIAVEAAIQSVSANNYDVTGLTTKTANTLALQGALNKMGDASQNVVCWVMYSKPYNDVIGQLISDKVTGLADIVTIQGAIPAFLGRPAVVTDAPALWDLNGTSTDTYNTLGLVRDAVMIEESEPDRFYTDIVGSLENLTRIWQSEYAYNITIKGKKWDVANGGLNPADAALGTTTNWDSVASDDKNQAGVRLVSQ